MARVKGFCRTVLDGPSGLLGDLIALLVRSLATTTPTRSSPRPNASKHAAPPGPVREAPTLTEREQEVLRCLQTRLTTREITGELYISMNTLKSHLKSINRKLGASSRSDAVARARTLGLL